MVVATAWLASRRLKLPAAAGSFLGAYVIGVAEIVVLVLALSTVDALHSSTLLLAVAAIFVGALVASALLPGGTRANRRWFRALRESLRDPVVIPLFLAVVAGFVYSALLLFLTPPNDWDALTYHLARAAFWIQQNGVGYVTDSDVLRINVNPPNAEIGTTFIMLLAGDDTYVGLVQYVAALATALGVFGLARRIGLATSESLFGALAFLSLPVVLLQSASALNDLVVASFLVAAAFFLLGATRAELALGGAAVALALGTKFTAFIALPLLALVVLAGQPRGRRVPAALAGVAGTCIGSYWLLANWIETGRLDGGAGDILDQHPDRGFAPVLARTTRMLVNFADDLNTGRDVRLYAVMAVTLGLYVVVAARGKRAGWVTGAAVVVVGCLPLALGTIHERLLQAHEKLWITMGRRDLAFFDVEREAWSPSTVLSYYGPLGFTLTAAGIATVIVARRRGAAPRLALLLAGAPVAMVLLVAFALVYDPWRARFLLFGLALAAATWGLVLRVRWLAWGVSSIGAVTVLLTFGHSLEKPATVWGKSRTTVQTWLRPDGTAELVRFFDGEPQTGRVGLDIREDDWVFPYFGRTLDREVVFVSSGDGLSSLDWLVVHPGRRDRLDGPWSLAHETADGWRVYRRSRG